MMQTQDSFDKVYKFIQSRGTLNDYSTDYSLNTHRLQKPV